MRWMVVLVAVVLAGCSDSGSADDPLDTRLEVDEVGTTRELGAISGVVVDPSIRPVAGATVRLVPTDETGTTGENGRFAFEELEPGFYTVEVQAHRFLPTQTSADVQAGQPTTVKVQITPDPEPEPFHETLEFHGLIVAGDIYGTWTLQDVIGDSAICTCDFPFEHASSTVTYVVEAAWEPTIPDPDHQIYFELLGSESRDGPATYLAPEETWMVPASGLADEPEQLLRISSGLVDVDQEVEVFLTAFHHKPPPDGWSFIAGDA